MGVIGIRTHTVDSQSKALASKDDNAVIAKGLEPLLSESKSDVLTNYTMRL